MDYYVELWAQGAWQIVHEGSDAKTALSVFKGLVKEGRRVRLEADNGEES